MCQSQYSSSSRLSDSKELVVRGVNSVFSAPLALDHLIWLESKERGEIGSVQVGICLIIIKKGFLLIFLTSLVEFSLSSPTGTIKNI